MRELLLAQGLVPYTNHENPLFAALEAEARMRSGLLTGRELPLFVVRSIRANAFTVSDPPGEPRCLVVTDRLLRDFQEYAAGVLSDPLVEAAYAEHLGA